MRYLEWDVLLFQANLKAPIQEFNTRCYVVIDNESSFHNTGRDGFVLPLDQIVPDRTPIVATNIASLPPGTPFKVSLHSWATPEPSKALLSLVHREDDAKFEVRVFIDGFRVSEAIFHRITSWPQTIDFSLRKNGDGPFERLSFPAYHQELEHSSLNLSSELRKIKIIIAEGMMSRMTGTFKRLRNIVIFSFLHSPLDVLEKVGVAYPNALMWFQPKMPSFDSQILSAALVDGSSDRTDHAHSPSRSGSERSSRESQMFSELYPSLSGSLPPGTSLLQAQSLALNHNLRQGRQTHAMWPIQDLFQAATVAPNNLRYRTYLNSSSDQSMPDIPQSASPGSSFGGLANFHDPRTDLSNDFSRVHTPPPWLVGQHSSRSGVIPPANTRMTSKEATPVHDATSQSKAEDPTRTLIFSSPSAPGSRSMHVNAAPPSHVPERSDVTMSSDSDSLSVVQVSAAKSSGPLEGVKIRKEGDVEKEHRDTTLVGKSLPPAPTQDQRTAAKDVEDTIASLEDIIKREVMEASSSSAHPATRRGAPKAIHR